jgi:hypothetical protein
MATSVVTLLLGVLSEKTILRRERRDQNRIVASTAPSVVRLLF